MKKLCFSDVFLEQYPQYSAVQLHRASLLIAEFHGYFYLVHTFCC